MVSLNPWAPLPDDMSPDEFWDALRPVVDMDDAAVMEEARAFAAAMHESLGGVGGSTQRERAAALVVELCDRLSKRPPWKRATPEPWTERQSDEETKRQVDAARARLYAQGFQAVNFTFDPVPPVVAVGVHNVKEYTVRADHIERAVEKLFNAAGVVEIAEAG